MSHHHSVTRRWRVVAFACCLGLVAAACGDDDDVSSAPDDSAADGESAGADVDEYCSTSAEIDEQDGPPTEAQLTTLKDTADEEISDEVDFVADAFIAADGDFGKVFADPAVEEKLGVIEDWEAEHCGGGEEFAVAPEHEEYCAFVEELDSGDGPPTEEQVLRLKELRPDEIGEETDAVVDAFVAAEGDIGVIFSDPELTEAFEAMEEHDAEICGFEVGEGDEPDTEAAEGAEIIPVTAVDFAFEGIPAEIAAGPVAFEFTNDGEAAHEMVIFQLGEGVDLAELLASEEEPSEEDAREAGGTFAPPGEGGVYANTELEPGDYAVICFIPGPEGKPHYDLGMQSTFTVS